MKDPRPGNLEGNEAEKERMARRIEELESENRVLKAENARLTSDNELLAEANGRLRESNMYDEKTGILNHRGGREEIELIAAGLKLPEEGEGEKRLGPRRKFSILFADIDKLKSINDTLGHDIGDLVIKSVADYLGESIRKGDVLCRWTKGDELLLAFQGADAQDVINKFFDKSEKRAKISLVVKTEAGDIEVTLSGGVTDYVPGESLDDAIKRADKALYESKENGRNRIAKYTEPGQQGK